MIPVCPPEPAPSEYPTEIRGRLRDAVSGLPLSGLAVSATLVGRRRGAKGLLQLGEAVSDSDGRFTLAVSGGRNSAQLLTLAQAPRQSVVLRVSAAGANRPYLTTQPLLLARGFLYVELAVALPHTAVPQTLWPEFARRLTEEGISHFNEIVERLLDGSANSLFGDWALKDRHALAEALEAALLDPSGRLRALKRLPSLAELHRPGALETYCAGLGEQEPEIREDFLDLRGIAGTFDDLFAIDWEVDPSDFANGRPENALIAARERYRVVPRVIEHRVR